MEITERDKNILLVITILTMGSLAFILLLAGLTSYVITVTPVLMVIGWFFGASMTFAYGKYKESKHYDKVH